MIISTRLCYILDSHTKLITSTTALLVDDNERSANENEDETGVNAIVEEPIASPPFWGEDADDDGDNSSTSSGVNDSEDHESLAQSQSTGPSSCAEELVCFERQAGRMCGRNLISPQCHHAD